MPASITLSQISWAAPDGRPLFSDLDLSFGTERTGLVGRNGVGKTTLLKLVSGEIQPQSGTVSVSGSLGLLRQSVQVAPHETVADLFGVAGALAVLRRAETGEATADELAAADWMLEARIAAALNRTGLDVEPETPLAALSGGQRTRAGFAALIFREPDFLLLDEPTNNLDRDGRKAVIALISDWRAGAIIVSHDRELLESVDAIVELTSLGVKRYGGHWSHYREHKALELAAARQDLADAEKRVAEVARKAQATVERQAHRDSAGRKMAAKGGIPRIMLGGMKERSETTGGGNARLAERRRADALEAATAAR
ncbi:ATP-binding cassette domain-containing protein, partial [Rhizobium sp. Pop5]